MKVEVDKNKEVVDQKGLIVVMRGPEGSGKTDIGRLIAQDLGLPYISTSDLLREIAEDGESELGARVRAMFERGAYLEGEDMRKILALRFAKDDCKNGFLVDGSLRTLEETVGFDLDLKEIDRGFPVRVVNLDLGYILDGKQGVWTDYQDLSLERCLGRLRDAHDKRDKILTKLGNYYGSLDLIMEEIRGFKNWEVELFDARLSLEEVYQNVREFVMNGIE